MAQIDLNDRSVVLDFARTFGKSEDRARQIIGAFNRPGRGAGDMSRAVDLSLSEETEMIRFLEKKALQTNVPPPRRTEDYTMVRVNIPKQSPEAPKKQQTRIPLSALDILPKEEKASTKPAVKDTEVPLRTTASKTQKASRRTHFRPPMKSSIGEITSKDQLVIDICTKFGVQQRQAEICIECYKYKYYGVGDMQKHAGTGNKASEIYGYLSSLHIKRDLNKPPTETFVRSKVYA